MGFTAFRLIKQSVKTEKKNFSELSLSICINKCLILQILRITITLISFEPMAVIH